jgi:hypothetical protein
MTHGYEVRPARPDELATVGALTVDGYRADGLLTRSGGTDRYEAELRAAARRAAAAELLVAAEPDGRLLGTVTWCPPGSGLRELATRPDQGEFRMLGSHPLLGAAASPPLWSSTAWPTRVGWGLPSWCCRPCQG